MLVSRLKGRDGRKRLASRQLHMNGSETTMWGSSYRILLTGYLPEGVLSSRVVELGWQTRMFL